MLINDASFGPYATLARSCLAKINYSLGAIEVKMMDALRLIEQAQSGTPDEHCF